MSQSQMSLLDQIFLDYFNPNKNDDFRCIYVDSYILDYDKSLNLNSKVAYPLWVFKNHPFFFLTEIEDYPTYKEHLNNWAKHFAYNLQNFIDQVTFKDSVAEVGSEKKLDFKKSQILKDSYAYLLEAEIYSGDKRMYFSIFIPQKALLYLIKLLTGQDLSKFSDIKLINFFIKKLRKEFYQHYIRMPLNIKEFFNTLEDKEFQRTIGILLSNNLLSYDILYVLAQKLDDGVNRVVNNLSNKSKQEFLEVVDNPGEQDQKWNEIALYQLSLSLEELSREKKLEIPQIIKWRKLLDQIELLEREVFFMEKSFYDWIKEASEENFLQDVLSQCKDLVLAKSFIPFNSVEMELITQNISKRKLQTLLEDINYQKNKANNYDIILAQLEIVRYIIDHSFSNLEEEELDINIWILRFKDEKELDFAANYVGPIDFSLMSTVLTAHNRKKVLDFLKAPLKYFLSYFLSNKIRLNFPFGEQRVKEACRKTVHTFYQLYKEDKIHLKSMDDIQEEIESLNEEKIS